MLENIEKKILTDMECPACGKKESTIRGNIILSNARTCVCGRVFNQDEYYCQEKMLKTGLWKLRKNE